MPANFTRRRDLFIDAGFADPDEVVRALVAEVKGLGLPEEWKGEGPAGGWAAVRRALEPRLQKLPADQRRLARQVPEWVANRSGDLATAIWLARAEHGQALDLAGFLLAVLDALVAEGRERDARAFARFMLDLRFDWERFYAESGLAYGFMQEREPNPLVWRLLEEFQGRSAGLRILEIGCGIGNDALGFFSSPRVERYVGIDVSQDALDKFTDRLARGNTSLRPELLCGDVLAALRERRPSLLGVNLVYSYSSLHYFSSGELSQIFALVHALLRGQEAQGFFAFGIKGEGSVWEGQGLPLYRPDVWINWDGQSRWFPSKRAIVKALDQASFEVRFHELAPHWGYSEYGKRDVFHWLLCSPRAAPG